MIELTYEAAMHVRDSHDITVLGRDEHVLGIAAFHGLANFADGRVATHRYEGWFELIDGSGRFHGYALWQFEDGSEIRAAYDGELREADPEGFEVSAQIRVLSGTGRFAAASGDGAFQGRRLEPIERGGRTQLSGTLRLDRAG